MLGHPWTEDAITSVEMLPRVETFIAHGEQNQSPQVVLYRAFSGSRQSNAFYDGSSKEGRQVIFDAGCNHDIDEPGVSRDPVDFLPSELIFKCLYDALPDSAKYASDLLMLTSVSQKWQQYILSTPLLWGNIYIDGLTQDMLCVITTFVHLSRTVPLTVTIFGDLETEWEAVSTPLLPHKHRIHILRFREQRKFLEAPWVCNVLRSFGPILELKEVDLPLLDSVDVPMNICTPEMLFRCRFLSLSEVKDVDPAIEHGNTLTPDLLDGIHGPAISCSLGNSLIRRFEWLGDVKDIDSAIRQLSKAVGHTPSEDDNRPTRLISLAVSFGCRFQKLGQVKDIDSAIERLTEAVNLTPFDSAHRPEYLTNLGNSLFRRFKLFRVVKDIDVAIERQTEAIDLTPLDSVDRPGRLNNLGNLFLCRFEWFGEVKDLGAAIQRQTQAVSLTPLDSSNLPLYLNNLGNLFLCRFERYGAVNDIDAAIERQAEAVGLTPLDGADRPRYLNNLGSSLMRRFENLGEVKDADAAIERQTEALHATPLDSAHRSGLLNGLGNSFMRLFERFGKAEDIDAAIKRQTEAVDLTPLNSDDLPRYLNNLGGSLMRRFERFGDAKDIDAAIKRQTEAVNLTPLDSAHRPGFLSNLGNSLLYIYKRFGVVRAIDEAIERQTEAVDLTPLDNVDLPGFLNNLGNSFLCLFERFGKAEHIDAAIERQIRAVNLTPLDSADRPRYLSNLGSSFTRRFEQFGRMEDVDAAIERQTQAIALTPLNNAHRPRYLNNLGGSLMRLFERSGEVKDIYAAIERQTEAVNLTPVDSADRSRYLNNLGGSFMYLFERTGEAKEIDAAIERQTEAIDLTPLDSADRPGYLNNLGVSFLRRFEQFENIKDQQNAANAFLFSSHSQNGMPITRMLASLQYARIMHLCEDFSSASEGYIQAAHLLPQVAWIGLDVVSQLKRFSPYIQSFGCDAAACMFSRAQYEHDHEQQHLGHAVEILDQTRSVLWSQASNLRQDLEDLRVFEPMLAEELERVGRTLGQSYFHDPDHMFSEAEGRDHRRCAEKWEELVLSARSLPGFDRFLLPLPISKLREAAKGGPVVIINISKYRSDALIISPKGHLEPLPLSSETAKRIDELAEWPKPIITSGGSQTPRAWEDTSTETNESLQEVLYEMWALIGEPIAKKFEESGILGSGLYSPNRVWWCPTGKLAFLPIHACLPRPTKADTRPVGMMDIAVSSYTPTLSSLFRAMHQKVARPFRMLAIGQPQSQRYPPLPYIKKEIEFIRHLLPHTITILNNSDANADAVIAALQTCTWAHFACPGVQRHDDPLGSGLLLPSDQILTLSRIARDSLEGAEFAFLSFCGSAKGSKLMPNESLHLAAGLQFLRFRGVIGTMWSVRDEDAFYVAKAVYEQLLGNSASYATASDAALALHLAVRRLHDEKKVPLARLVPFIHFGF